MGKHALCSASSGARWIACPPSAKLNAEASDQGSPYAQQGTEAHAVCEYLLLKALGRPAEEPYDSLCYYDQEMEECTEGYRDFVMEQVTAAKEHCPDPFIGVEQRLDFSRWVPEGFGTGDCVIIADDILHVIDFKYGVGVLVDAEKNVQMMCYALGALDTFGDLYRIDKIKLSIYQPRRENVSTWGTNKEDLLKWAETTLAPAAKLAFEGKGEFQAGKHCQFCKVKETCRARAEYNMELLKFELKDPVELSNEEIALILPKVEDLVSWATDVKKYALDQALLGNHFDGFKVVEGRSTRKYLDEAKVASVVEKAGYDPYEKKILGITAMTKILGQKKFNELLGELVYKPHGSPVLVEESDKRPEYTAVSINDFHDNMEE